MVEIDRNRIIEKLIYDKNTGVFVWQSSHQNRIKPGTVAGTINNQGYIRIKFDKKLIMAHRLAWFVEYGRWPIGQIDHINGIKSDNRIENLREASPKKNSENSRVGRKRKNGGSLLGASYIKRNDKWRSTICHNGKMIHLGVFSSEQAAHDAYLSAKRMIHEGCTI